LLSRVLLQLAVGKTNMAPSDAPKTKIPRKLFPCDDFQERPTLEPPVSSAQQALGGPGMLVHHMSFGLVPGGAALVEIAGETSPPDVKAAL
jgi:hypothetical protein